MGGAPADRRRGESPVGHAKGRPFASKLYETGDSMNKIYVFGEEHCVICGVVVPEGRQVCPLCEQDAKYAPNKLIDLQRGIPAPGLICRLQLWLRGAFGR